MYSRTNRRLFTKKEESESDENSEQDEQSDEDNNSEKDEDDEENDEVIEEIKFSEIRAMSVKAQQELLDHLIKLKISNKDELIVLLRNEIQTKPKVISPVKNKERSPHVLF